MISNQILLSVPVVVVEGWGLGASWVWQEEEAVWGG